MAATLELYRFAFFDPLRRRWITARHVLAAPEIRCRYPEFELIGTPERRSVPDEPWRSLSAAHVASAAR